MATIATRMKIDGLSMGEAGRGRERGKGVGGCFDDK